MPAPNDPVLVLAAGRGTRMGGPKALMSVAGRSWWQQQHERLQAAQVRDIWVASPQVRQELSATLTCVDSDADAPMFESIRAGLRFLTDNPPRGVFILPVDVPAAQVATWRLLATSLVPAAPSHHGAHGHPIWLPWTAAVELVSAPPGSRLDKLLAPDLQYIDVDDATVAVNLNTRADVLAWEASRQ